METIILLKKVIYKNLYMNINFFFTESPDTKLIHFVLPKSDISNNVSWEIYTNSSVKTGYINNISESEHLISSKIGQTNYVFLRINIDGISKITYMHVDIEKEMVTFSENNVIQAENVTMEIEKLEDIVDLEKLENENDPENNL